MIDYGILNSSTIYYEKQKYKRIESPWTVSKYVSNLTKPESQKVNFELKHNDKCLVASREQSFLYLYLKDFLPKGRYQTITPCFRYEDFDNLHSKYFIKNELIITDNPINTELEIMVDQALTFFQAYLKEDVTVKHINSNQFDLEYKGIELGSYGIRSIEYLTWIYGTGCAEPRLSNIINQFT